jgi:hypothetical protein
MLPTEHIVALIMNQALCSCMSSQVAFDGCSNLKAMGRGLFWRLSSTCGTAAVVDALQCLLHIWLV